MDIKTLTKQKWFVPAAVVLGLLIVGGIARSSRDHSRDVDRTDGKVHVKTDEGEWSSGGSMPSDWPSDVPVYEDAKVQYSASSNPADGSAGSYLVLSSSDSVSKVAAFYKKELAADDWTITSTAEVNGGTYLTAKKADRDLSLTVTPSEGGSSILIGVAKQK